VAPGPNQKPGRCSVSSALPHIASQQAEGARRAFQRGHLQNYSEDVYLAAQLLLFEDFRTRKTRSERIHSLQASQNELAEPFKYSNSLHTSSTMVCCIPKMRASRVGEGSLKRASQRNFIEDFSGLAGLRSLTGVRDFACGLGRPQDGSTRIPREGGLRSLTGVRDFACGLGRPARRLNQDSARGRFEIPHWRSGFRRARTPARRLNLLKRFSASTLGIFRSE
jgi:hypothetical protein